MYDVCHPSVSSSKLFDSKERFIKTVISLYLSTSFHVTFYFKANLWLSNFFPELFRGKNTNRAYETASFIVVIISVLQNRRAGLQGRCQNHHSILRVHRTLRGYLNNMRLINAGK